jgi:type I restriction enzyme, R subunit
VRTSFKLFDFFANCECFEKESKYDEVRKFPKPTTDRDEIGGDGNSSSGNYDQLGGDILSSLKEEAVGNDGMKIDRMFYEKLKDSLRENDVIASSIAVGQWDRVIIDGPKRLTSLYTTFSFTAADLKAVPAEYRKIIPEYIKDYV